MAATQVGHLRQRNFSFGRCRLGRLCQIKSRFLHDMQQQLGLDAVPDDIYYQLLHRTASAMIGARRFNARYAVMLVHSFSPTGSWFEEYARFLNLFGVTAQKDRLHHLNAVDGINLYAAWVTGDSRFLEV